MKRRQDSSTAWVDRGFCHLYIGQEAVVVGMQAAIDSKSSVVTSYRDHGHMLACGMDPNGVMAELTGRVGGTLKAKAEACTCLAEKRIFGGHGIVAAQVPIGTGLAFGHKYRDEKAVCLTYLGDGAINQGRYTKVSIWLLCGSYPASTLSRITNMAWGPRFHGRQQAEN